MKPLFAILTSSLLATTPVFASTNDSPMGLCEATHSATSKSAKRTLSVALGQEDALAQKRTRGTEQPTPPHLSSPTLLGTPAEVLFHLFSFMGKEDLASLACTGKDFKDLILTYQLNKTSPTRVWSSALTFCQDAECEKMRALFVRDVMPPVMEALLVAFKTQTPHAYAHLWSLLDDFAGLESHGQTLGYRPLWQFIYGLKGAAPKDVKPENFFKEGPIGDGDRVFLNLLHYIKNNFEKEPKDLPAYDAPRNPRHPSPQALMHKASLLKAELPLAQTHTERAKILDEILETFDDFTPQELERAAQAYKEAARENDGALRRTLYIKSARMWRALFAQVAVPASSVREAALIYRNIAAFSITNQEKQRAYAESAGLWDAFLNHQDAPHAQDVREAALVHHSAAYYTTNDAQKAYHFAQSANLWDTLITDFSQLGLSELKDAAIAYQCAAQYAQDPRAVGPRSIKSASFWRLFLEHAPNPTAFEFKEAASAQLNAVPYAADEVRRSLYYRKSAKFWDGYIAEQERPDLLEMKDAAAAYQGAAFSTQNPLKKNGLFLKSAKWWLLYLNQVKNPDLIAANRALSVFEIAMSLTQDPLERSAMKRLIRKLQAMNVTHQEAWATRQ
ncbi:MAG: hypothetical protein C0514_09250 [Candidatus Puniceispirillum sp.]|nr:hypothetical protein [Candidatus Puniceispirillum sp.]